MMPSNREQLKAWIKKMSKNIAVNENIILQNYMLERLLERISKSEYKYKFILKGGMLISAIVGIDMRNTLDLDATIKGINLEKDNLIQILKEILNIDIQDGIEFNYINIKDIRQEDKYGGYRISIEGKFDKITVPMKLDISTGDIIVPKEINYKFYLMFEERAIEILAYNLETVISDKIETIISRNIDNTRARDFYDIYILWTTQSCNFSRVVLKKAILEKFNYRETAHILDNIDEILEAIEDSDTLKGYWNNYKNKFNYASEIEYKEIMKVLREILNLLN